jgi:hypothetical protein
VTNGVGRIVRVLGLEAIAAMQFTRLTTTAGYKVDEVATIEEAEKLLDEK